MKKLSSATKSFNLEKLDTIVSTGIEIEGKFTSIDCIRLDCKVMGEVISESLYLGESGYIKGDINCENIIISGKIDGNVNCNGKMHIKETGVVNGDIIVNTLSMEEGATFTGKCIKKDTKDKMSKHNKNSKIESKTK
ncbi:polymer-forming cytoskeletal protein [Sedimentibacter sp. zth1]|uniref:bactofilin family protein n=1 Tax=Sedimentibacter sp. zth1 TaxID=2816908 RepID=UPI001A931896|nr:polymer-forming cytoskeletal protein [Sedimentibacter sp. zth1]QSX04690.1 polymer-forming cytoskeletal protein [Sedimentibacter sp. zth1]